MELFSTKTAIKDFCAKLGQLSFLKDGEIPISQDEALQKKHYLIICGIERKSSHSYKELAALLNLKED